MVWLWENVVTVCKGIPTGQLTWTPDTAHNTRTAPSKTRNARSTSIVKSTWPDNNQSSMSGPREKGGENAPGVSMMLTAYVSCSPVTGDFAVQSQNVAAL